ncbi:MAG: 50S ribosome-binding GTPase, partial [Synergistaceae bacterium]|nr:50S ribosome-binding GTPase [Synergistaceae bacterium]
MNDFNWIESQLKKIGLSDEAAKWGSFRAILDVDFSKFRLIAVGRQNSGKSTLLNTLCGSLD